MSYSITNNKIPFDFSPYGVNATPINITIKPSAPGVKKIIFNNPATVVFWKDGTKTVVKCMEGQPFSEYYGFLCALGKKIYGSNSKLSNIIKQYTVENSK